MKYIMMKKKKYGKNLKEKKVTLYLEPGANLNDIYELIEYGKRYKKISELINKTIKDLKEECLHSTDKLAYEDVLHWIKKIFKDFGILIITEEDELKANEIEGSDLTSGFTIKIRQ